MFVRAAPPHLVEEVGKILCRLICVLSSSAKLEFVGGKFSIICGCCNFQNGEVSFFLNFFLLIKNKTLEELESCIQSQIGHFIVQENFCKVLSFSIFLFS